MLTSEIRSLEQIIDDLPAGPSDTIEENSDDGNEETPPPPPPPTVAATLDAINTVRAYFSSCADSYDDLVQINRLESHLLADSSKKMSKQSTVDSFFRRI